MVKGILEAEGFEIIGEDEAFFCKFVNRKLLGEVGIHVDNFLIVGKKKFVEEVIAMVKSKLKVTKAEWDKMKFMEIDIDASVPGMIKVIMEAYMSTITKFNTSRSRNPKEPLNSIEVKLLRGYIGKLLWLSGNV